MSLKSNLYHIQLNISNPSISIPFYKKLFLYLDYKISQEGEDYIGFSNGINDFWLIGTESKYINNQFHRKNTGINHIAFLVDTKEKVDEFNKMFLSANNIAALYDSPKLFPEYSKDYYSVFFEDPDRLKLEILYRAFEDEGNKRFLSWHSKKIIINKKTSVPDFSERDIWWCSIGSNIGFEQDGKGDDFERPVLVFKKFSKDVFIGIPLTSIVKDSRYYFSYPLHDRQGSFILSQSRLLSSKRLNRRISKVGVDIYNNIMKNYLELFISDHKGENLT